MKEFVRYNEPQIDNGNRQNIVFELAARAIVNGDRIIIEQDKTYGQKYLMVDFCPSDGSNGEWPESDDGSVCMITSVDNDSETGEGEFYSTHRNYIDGINEVCRILRENRWTVIYTESY